MHESDTAAKLCMLDGKSSKQCLLSLSDCPCALLDVIFTFVLIIAQLHPTITKHRCTVCAARWLLATLFCATDLIGMFLHGAMASRFNGMELAKVYRTHTFW